MSMKWVSQDGTEWELTDMEDTHICNTLYYIIKNAEAYAALDWLYKFSTDNQNEEEENWFNDPDNLTSTPTFIPLRPYPDQPLKYLKEYCDIYLAIKKEIDSRGIISEIFEVRR